MFGIKRILIFLQKLVAVNKMLLVYGKYVKQVKHFDGKQIQPVENLVLEPVHLHHGTKRLDFADIDVRDVVDVILDVIVQDKACLVRYGRKHAPYILIPARASRLELVEAFLVLAVYYQLACGVRRGKLLNAGRRLDSRVELGCIENI